MARGVGREIGLATIGTFHHRQGDQTLLTNRRPFSGAWGRAYGNKLETTARVDGAYFDFEPAWDGDVLGAQVGVDLFAGDGADGGNWRIGVTFAHAQGQGDVEGNLLPGIRERTGTLDMKADYLGAYATYIGREGWYLDAVALHGWYDMRAVSSAAVEVELDGESEAASLEAGYPVRLGAAWLVEPQVQIVWQKTTFDRPADPFSNVDFEPDAEVIGRLGLRLEHSMLIGTAPVSPFVSMDWIHPFEDSAGIIFDGNSLNVYGVQDVLKVGAGFNAQLTPALSSYLTVDWGTAVDGERYETFGWTLGVRLVW
jgi:autotransporter family porin